MMQDMMMMVQDMMVIDDGSGYDDDDSGYDDNGSGYGDDGSGYGDDGSGYDDDGGGKFVECAHNRETVEGDEALSRNGNWGPGCKRAPQKGTRNFTRWK